MQSIRCSGKMGWDSNKVLHFKCVSRSQVHIQMSFKLSVRTSCNLARCPHKSHVTVLSCTLVFICKTHFSSKGRPVPAHLRTSFAKPDVMSITARIVGCEEENFCLLQGKKSANWRALGLHMQFDGDCSASGQDCNVPPQGYWVAGKISLWTAVQRHTGAQCNTRGDGSMFPSHPKTWACL